MYDKAVLKRATSIYIQYLDEEALVDSKALKRIGKALFTELTRLCHFDRFHSNHKRLFPKKVSLTGEDFQILFSNESCLSWPSLVVTDQDKIFVTYPNEPTYQTDDEDAIEIRHTQTVRARQAQQEEELQDLLERLQAVKLQVGEFDDTGSSVDDDLTLDRSLAYHPGTATTIQATSSDSANASSPRKLKATAGY